MPQYALGLDFGTNSVRALVVNCADGREVGTGVQAYHSGTEGVVIDPKDPNLARQAPSDYFQCMLDAIDLARFEAIKKVGFDPKELVGIGVDTTGSTPMPVTKHGIPLGLTNRSRAAMAWLWKDHTSHAESEEITAKARQQGRPYLEKCGGAYSSEWFWSKVLHCARTDPKVFDKAYSWMELSDYVPSMLTARYLSVPINVCAAGHKAMYSKAWGGLPASEFLSELDPRLSILRGRLYDIAYPSDHLAGQLEESIAQVSGLSAGVPVAVGILDAHAGAVGSGVAPGRMVKIIGTSTCDILVSPVDDGVPDIPGVAGIVDGSVIPGMVGIEAGQSAVGDIFAWWSRVSGRTQESLSEDAASLKAGESGLLALDWNNGNRNVLADPLLTGLIVGQTLHTSAPEIYRALIEATAFGALKIIRRIEKHGVVISELVACGGIADKSPLAMQIYADVLNRPIRLSRSSQAPALGAAVFGAVVGGAHSDVLSAQAAMIGFKNLEYRPNGDAARVYERLFGLYKALHDGFGLRGPCDLQPVMKELIRIKNEVRR